MRATSAARCLSEDTAERAVVRAVFILSRQAKDFHPPDKGSLPGRRGSFASLRMTNGYL